MGHKPDKPTTPALDAFSRRLLSSLYLQAIMDTIDIHEGQLKDASSHEIEDVDATEVISFTPEEEKALVRKIDMTLLPTVWVMYLLSYLDRTK